MVALKQITDEPLSLSEKLAQNGEKLKLASIGFASLVEEGSGKLYRQAMSMGDNYMGDQNLIGRMATLGLGTLRLMQEESQRLFDELVAEGEDVVERRTLGQNASGGGAELGVRGADKIRERRSVARTLPASMVNAIERADSPVVPPRAASSSARAASSTAKAKPSVSETVTPADKVAERLNAKLRVRLQQAQCYLDTLEDLTSEQQAHLAALKLQAEDGDVRGRRPGVKRAAEQNLFDQRKLLKGMSGEEAVLRFEALVEELRGVPQS